MIINSVIRLLDQLLTEIWEGLDGRSGRPPSQEQECIATSALNLLRLQLMTMKQHRDDVAGVSLGPGTALLASIKKKVVELASSSGVLDTVQVTLTSTLMQIKTLHSGKCQGRAPICMDRASAHTRGESPRPVQLAPPPGLGVIRDILWPQVHD